MGVEGRLSRRTPKAPLEGSCQAAGLTERCSCGPALLPRRRVGSASRRAAASRPYCVRARRGHSGGAGWTASGGGLFRAVRSFQNAPGLRSPVPLLGPVACIPGSGIARVVALLQAVLSAASCPFKASRGTVKSQSRYGYAAIL